MILKIIASIIVIEIFKIKIQKDKYIKLIRSTNKIQDYN